MSSFLTGSRAYGTPHEESDYDHCILLSDHAARCMVEVFEEREGSGCNSGSNIMYASFKIGRLNILIFTDLKQFEVWRRATEFLITKAPVTRKKAVKYIRKKLHKAGYLKPGEV